MRREGLIFIVCIIAAMIHLPSYAQDSITDYDGYVYHTIEIGNQVWLRENLKSLHYADGSEISGVVAFNNSDSMANIYGRLYPWNAAMNNSIISGSQGACPDHWHIPTNAEWTAMDNYLGGWSVAGGKMKEAGFDHWLPPNTGATNSSGFTGLPAGEFDANQSQNFLFLGQAAVFWTSNQNGSLMAIERYLSYDDEKSGQLPWYKTMKYSVRCIKDVETGNHSDKSEREYNISVSNPFKEDLTIISSNLRILHINLYDLTGKKLPCQYWETETCKVTIETNRLREGLYILETYSVPVNNSASLSLEMSKRDVFKCVKITKP